MPSPTAARVGPVRAHSRDGFRIFIDFDNTITIGDVLDGVIEKFAVGDRWRELEIEWEAGKIGARDCLDGQLRSLRAEWPELTRHLDAVQLDPGFSALLTLARREQIDLTILSDNFDLLLGYILQRRGLGDVAFFGNHLERAADRFLPSFPFSNPDCPGCAHCKKTHFLPPNDDPRHVVYIGDGRSDLCPARHADIVFAKAGLLKQLRAEQVACHAFDGLADVARVLEKIFHESQL